jgi:hypothetical protein
MTLRGRLMVFENSADFIKTGHIHGVAGYPDSAFGPYRKLEKGKFGFEILDDEIYVMIKLSL